VINNGPSRNDVTSAWLQDTLEDYLLKDDVVRPDFFSKVLLFGEEEIEAESLETKWRISIVRSLRAQEGKKYTNGPHIVHEGSLWRVLRLNDDVQKKFIVTLRQDDNGR
jgi:hypothetical protein